MNWVANRKHWLIQGGVFAVLAFAFYTSFKSGGQGAQYLGFAPEFRYVVPTVCDVVAAVATVIHGDAADKAMRRLAAWYVLVPMILSWAANAIDHAWRVSHTADGWTATAVWAWFVGVILFAGICPIAVAALLHLSAKYRESVQRQQKRAEQAGQRQQASSPTPSKSPGASSSEPKVTSADVSRARAAWSKAARQPGANELEVRALKRKFEALKKAMQRQKKAEEEEADAVND